MRFDAIIFDCDGTLVDSEVLGNRVLVECAAELGVTLTVEEAVERFRGGRMADSLAYIERMLGRPAPEDFAQAVRRRMIETFEAQLRPVDGAEAVLRSLSTPFCVASNGPGAKMEASLRVTGLLPYVQGRIFSAYDIGSWKPDPGLFLHAARTLGVAPERCAVVEDSVLGVEAGCAARMTVFGYAPAGEGEVLAGAGARPFSRMSELLPLLCGIA